MERGIIVQISGPVIDVEIQQGNLPRLREELTVEKGGVVRVMEVAQHIGNNTVRCVMLYLHVDDGTGYLYNDPSFHDLTSPSSGAGPWLRRRSP